MGNKRLTTATSGNQRIAGEAGSGAARANARKGVDGHVEGHYSGARPDQPAGVSSKESLLISLEKAALLLGYTPIGLRKIVNRSRDKATGKTTSGPTIRFFQTCKSAPIKFRIEWIEEFIDRYSVDPNTNESGPPSSTIRHQTSRPGPFQGKSDHGF